MATYDYDLSSGQSSVKVALGERLCEGTLLRGMLVHSAGNYAAMLIEMMGMSASTFVTMMNGDARSLGLRQTHYVDFTGISPGDVSTAQDQSVVAVNLMTNEPIVRDIVALANVKLPVAGLVESYTPFEGQYGVIGVKSGFTTPAGGCDAMAIRITLNNAVITTYAVVLGVHGADAINRAGQMALVLAQSIRAELKAAPLSVSGPAVEWIGWPGYLTTTPATATTSSTSTSTTSSTTTTTGP